jgi:hypothetical protein
MYPFTYSLLNLLLLSDLIDEVTRSITNKIVHRHLQVIIFGIGYARPYHTIQLPASLYHQR